MYRHVVPLRMEEGEAAYPQHPDILRCRIWRAVTTYCYKGTLAVTLWTTVRIPPEDERFEKLTGDTKRAGHVRETVVWESGCVCCSLPVMR